MQGTRTPLGSVCFIQARRGCRGLSPARAVPDEGIESSNVREGVVVVGAQVLHDRTSDHRIGLVGCAFGAIVRHKHYKGVCPPAISRWYILGCWSFQGIRAYYQARRFARDSQVLYRC